MSLRAAAERLRRSRAHPTLSHERLFATQRAAAALEGRRLDDGRRTAAARALRARIARGETAAIEEALAAERRSLDRAIVHACLAAMPGTGPHFEALRAAAETAAARHGWPFRETDRR